MVFILMRLPVVCLTLMRLAYEDNDATGENRWVLLGMSHQARLLVVIYTVRGESIRLISARKPTTKEANNYA